MRLSEIIDQAAEGFNLARSRERREAELLFPTQEDANRFVEWCALNRIATQDTDKRTVTIFLDG